MLARGHRNGLTGTLIRLGRSWQSMGQHIKDEQCTQLNGAMRSSSAGGTELNGRRSLVERPQHDPVHRFHNYESLFERFWR
jgi:hypothetical protein